MRPSGLNATAATAPSESLRGLPRVVGWVRSVTFHSWIAPAVKVGAPLPEARVCPLGLNATELKGVAGPVRGSPRAAGWARSVIFHNWIALELKSPPALTRECPSGLSATETTSAGAAVRGLPRATGWAGSVTFQSWIVPGPLPLASVRPSGLNATELTEVFIGSLLSGPGSRWEAVPRSFHAVVAPIAASPVSPPAAIRNRRRDGRPTVVVGGLKVTVRGAALTGGWRRPPGKAPRVLLAVSGLTGACLADVLGAGCRAGTGCWGTGDCRGEVDWGTCVGDDAGGE